MVREGVLTSASAFASELRRPADTVVAAATPDRHERNTIVSRRERLGREVLADLVFFQIDGFSDAAAGREGRLVKRSGLAVDVEEATLGRRQPADHHRSTI